MRACCLFFPLRALPPPPALRPARPHLQLGQPERCEVRARRHRFQDVQVTTSGAEDEQLTTGPRQRRSALGLESGAERCLPLPRPQDDCGRDAACGVTRTMMLVLRGRPVESSRSTARARATGAVRRLCPPATRTATRSTPAPSVALSPPVPMTVHALAVDYRATAAHWG